MRPIPRCIMSNTATLRLPNEVDKYNDCTYTDIELTHIHIQPVHMVEKTKENTQINLSAILFYDPQISSPDLDWEQIGDIMGDKSRQCKVIYKSKEYTIHAIDFCPDVNGLVHHIELFLY